MPEIYKPSPLEKRSQAERFADMNAWIGHRNGWIVSSPGAPMMRVEALEGSTLPAELETAGYDVEFVGHRERLLTAGITERLQRTSSGWLVPAVEGSTKPIVERHYAGIARVTCVEFKF